MNILEICTLFVTFVVFKMGYSYYAYDKYYKPINNKDYQLIHL